MVSPIRIDTIEDVKNLDVLKLVQNAVNGGKGEGNAITFSGIGYLGPCNLDIPKKIPGFMTEKDEPKYRAKFLVKKDKLTGVNSILDPLVNKLLTEINNSGKYRVSSLEDLIPIYPFTEENTRSYNDKYKFDFNFSYFNDDAEYGDYYIKATAKYGPHLSYVETRESKDGGKVRYYPRIRRESIQIGDNQYNKGVLVKEEEDLFNDKFSPGSSVLFNLILIPKLVKGQLTFCVFMTEITSLGKGLNIKVRVAGVEDSINSNETLKNSIEQELEQEYNKVVVKEEESVNEEVNTHPIGDDDLPF